MTWRLNFRAYGRVQASLRVCWAIAVTQCLLKSHKNVFTECVNDSQLRNAGETLGERMDDWLKL